MDKLAPILCLYFIDFMFGFSSNLSLKDKTMKLEVEKNYANVCTVKVKTTATVKPK